MGWADVGAGGAEGLEKLFSRLLTEDKLAEEKRSNRASEGLRGQEIEEQGKYRLAQQQIMTDNQRRVDEDRDAARVVGKAEKRPMGSEVTPQERDTEIKAGMPSALYKESPAQLPSTEFMPVGRVTENKAKPGVVNFVGTESQQAAAGRQRDLEAQRDEANRQRDDALGIRHHAENRLTSWGAPTITVSDPNNPGSAKVMHRDEVPKGGMAARLGGPEEQKVHAYQTTLQMIDDLEKEHPTAEWGPALGPLDAGILAKARGVLPHSIPGVSGLSGGDKGEKLRDKLSRLRAQASFQEGGKQFTGTEAELMSSFLALIEQQPEVAATRLAEFKKQAQSSLAKLQTAAGAGGAGGGEGRKRRIFDPATGTFKEAQ